MIYLALNCIVFELNRFYLNPHLMTDANFIAENHSRRELNNRWGMSGGKDMPSVLYRVRMIGIVDPAKGR